MEGLVFCFTHDYYYPSLFGLAFLVTLVCFDFIIE